MTEWQPIETVPNNVFDVLAKYYDASLDTFLYKRFADCVKVGDSILCGKIELIDIGYRPLYWMHIPEFPEELKNDRI